MVDFQQVIEHAHISHQNFEANKAAYINKIEAEWDQALQEFADALIIEFRPTIWNQQVIADYLNQPAQCSVHLNVSEILRPNSELNDFQLSALKSYMGVQ